MSLNGAPLYQRDRLSALASLERGQVLQTTPLQEFPRGSKEQTSMVQALADLLAYPASTTVRNRITVAGSLLEYRLAVPFIEGHCSTRNGRVWLDGTGIANRHSVTSHLAMHNRMTSSSDVEVSKRLRVATPLSQREGGARTSEASDALSRIVAGWCDDVSCTWSPLFERMWAGYYAAYLGVTPAGALAAGSITPDELWPSATNMCAALIDLRVGHAGLSRVLIRETTEVLPRNLAVFDILCAVTTAQLGFEALADRGNCHSAATAAYGAATNLLIVPRNNRPAGYRAGYTAASLTNAVNWIAAIYWLVEQGLPVEDCLQGAVAMMRHCLLFVSPFVMHLPTHCSERFVGVDSLPDVALTRMCVMRYKTASAVYADRGADTRDALDKLTTRPVAAEAALAVDPAGRAGDIQWLAWMHGCRADRRAVSTLLSQTSTSVLLNLCCWAADDTWERAWVGGLRGLGHTTLPPPTNRTRAQFQADIASGGVVRRSESLPVFNMFETVTQMQSSGVDELYQQATVGNLLKSAPNSLRTVLRSATPDTVMHSIIALALTCRAVTDHNTSVFGMSYVGFNLGTGIADTGVPILDNHLNNSVDILSALNQRQWVNCFAVGIDLAMAACGAATSLASEYASCHNQFSPACLRGLWARFRYIKAAVLHPLMQQLICPGFPTVGGAVARRMQWVSQMAHPSVQPHLGFAYGGDFTPSEMVGAIQLVASWGGQWPTLSITTVIGSEFRGQATTERALDWEFGDRAVRDSDTFMGVPTLAVAPIWLFSAQMRVQIRITGVTSYHDHGLYVLPWGNTECPVVSRLGAVGAMGSFEDEGSLFLNGQRAYVENADKASKLRCIGLRADGARWGALTPDAGEYSGALLHGVIQEGYTHSTKTIETAFTRLNLLKPMSKEQHSLAGPNFFQIAINSALNGSFPYAAGWLGEVIQDKMDGRTSSHPDVPSLDRPSISELLERSGVLS